MSVSLSLICHGATEATRRAAFPQDEPLDPQSQARAALLGTTLRRVDHAMTSPAARARQTAAAFGLDPAVDPMLADADYGRWAGRPMEAIEAEEPDALMKWIADADTAPHGGESVAQVVARMACWLDQMSRLQGKIVAIAHAANLRAALVTVLNAELQAFWRIDAGPFCRLNLQARGGMWTLRSIGPLRAPSADGGRVRPMLPDEPPS